MDLNLLTALDALLREGSVTGAAERLQLSKPAMSRALGRLRKTLHDPVLTRAGRSMVLSPLAIELAPRVHTLVEQARALLHEGHHLELSTLRRTFTIRANDVLVSVLGAELLRIAHAEAPLVRLRFAPEGDEDVQPLRDGLIDLDLGMIGETGPEIHVQPLFSERVVAVTRPGHPLADGPVTWERLAAYPHIAISRRGRATTALDEYGHSPEVAAVVPSAPSAVYLLLGSDAVSLFPASFAAMAGLTAYDLPSELIPVPLSQAWHPRFDADPAHTWLRGCLQRVCVGFR